MSLITIDEFNEEFAVDYPELAQCYSIYEVEYDEYEEGGSD